MSEKKKDRTKEERTKEETLAQSIEQADIQDNLVKTPDKESSKRSCVSFREGALINKEWKIQVKLDEGGFGKVYRVVHVKYNYPAALKAEPSNIEGGSAIKLEAKILSKLFNESKTEIKEHVPKLFYARKRKMYNYMIMTLLGKNLKSLKAMCPNEIVPMGTWTRIGMQCLYCIKLLHDIGYIHRDIKPGNFMMGYSRDPARCHLVHLVDFGLARAYAVLHKGKWISRRARGSVEFRGTARYASPSVHEKFEQGRKDDIWSLMYMLIEFHCGLPWQKEKTREKLELVKLSCPDSVLVKNFPEELHSIFSHLRSLDCYQRPNYEVIYRKLRFLMTKSKTNFNDKYAWENDDDYLFFRENHTQDFHYEDCIWFMRYDPQDIHSPPDKKSLTFEKIIKKKTIEENA